MERLVSALALQQELTSLSPSGNGWSFHMEFEFSSFVFRLSVGTTASFHSLKTYRMWTGLNGHCPMIIDMSECESEGLFVGMCDEPFRIGGSSTTLKRRIFVDFLAAESIIKYTSGAIQALVNSMIIKKQKFSFSSLHIGGHISITVPLKGRL